MTNKTFLSLAYNTYSNVLYVVNTVVDNDFISITEFADLIKIILNYPKLEPYFINKLLIDTKIIIKNPMFDKSNPTSIKYIPVNSASQYYKRIYMTNRPFLIWDFNFLFSIFNVDFQKELTKQSAQNVCNTLNKYIYITSDIDDVFDKLLQLQILLYAERKQFN